MCERHVHRLGVGRLHENSLLRLLNSNNATPGETAKGEDAL
jgi:hypothetical protein